MGVGDGTGTGVGVGEGEGCGGRGTGVRETTAAYPKGLVKKLSGSYTPFTCWSRTRLSPYTLDGEATALDKPENVGGCR